jgi:hypothetical protein
MIAGAYAFVRNGRREPVILGDYVSPTKCKVTFADGSIDFVDTWLIEFSPLARQQFHRAEVAYEIGYAVA